MRLRGRFRKCMNCGSKYMWSPEQGQITCPYCEGKPQEEIKKKVLLPKEKRRKW